jgi:hypothetical protein
MGLYEDHARGRFDAEAAQAYAAAAGLSVDADNVLYVRKAILDEHKELLTVLGGEARDASSTAKPYGGDPVSIDASVAFPQRADLLLKQCAEHVSDLLAIAEKLKDAALTYGYTEGEIAAASPVNVGAAVGGMNATIHAILNPWERG